MKFNKLELELKIQNWVSGVAGIASFCELDKKNKIETKNSGIVLENNKNIKNGVDVTIGIIILVNINAKIIVEEIYQLLNYNLEKMNLKLTSLSVYIKGIK